MRWNVFRTFRSNVCAHVPPFDELFAILSVLMYHTAATTENVYDNNIIMYFDRLRRLLQKRNAAALCTSAFKRVYTCIYVRTRKKK